MVCFGVITVVVILSIYNLFVEISFAIFFISLWFLSIAKCERKRKLAFLFAWHFENSETHLNEIQNTNRWLFLCHCWPSTLEVDLNEWMDERTNKRTYKWMNKTECLADCKPLTGQLNNKWQNIKKYKTQYK